MSIFLLKLILTPTLIGVASLAGRKWGLVIGGWFVALPLISGPIVFLLALTHGTAFAAEAAAGILAGGFSLSAFSLTYMLLARRWTWLPTLAASSLAFGLMTAILQNVRLPLLLLWTSVVAGFAIVLRVLPRDSGGDTEGRALPPRWDIPLRMAIATAFVLLITGLAPAMGPHLTGLLTPFPLFTATLAAFAHHQHGPASAVQVFRGMLTGLFSYAGFLFTLALLLEPAGIAGAFAVAIAVVGVLQAGALWLLKNGNG
jgi:uncharacterized membrane protein (GlpM family)